MENVMEATRWNDGRSVTDRFSGKLADLDGTAEASLRALANRLACAAMASRREVSTGVAGDAHLARAAHVRRLAQ